MSLEGFYRYVRHSDVQSFCENGWVFICELQPPHGLYAVLMQWRGE